MSYYEVLEINKNANDVEIKKAYRQKSLHYHPDRNHSLDSVEKMKQINYLKSAKRTINLESEALKKEAKSLNKDFSLMRISFEF